MSKTHGYKRGSDGSGFADRAADVFKVAATGQSINGASGIAAWVPAAAKQVRLMGFIVSNDTAGTLAITNGAGTTLVGIGVDNTRRSVSIPLPGKGVLLPADSTLMAKSSAGLTTLTVYGTEETPSPE